LDLPDEENAFTIGAAWAGKDCRCERHRAENRAANEKHHGTSVPGWGKTAKNPALVGA
jgi:hypothetical protein